MSNDFVSLPNRFLNEYVGALEKGTSVLQGDGRGVRYSANMATGTVYAGVNQLLLQQARKDNKWENPYFINFDDASSRGFFVKPGEHGQSISWWNNSLRYKKDITDADGVIHTKGSIKYKDGAPERGYDFDILYNAAQIDVRMRKWDYDKQQHVVASNAIALAPNPQLTVPFTVEPGVAYSVEKHGAISDVPAVHKLLEASSKYLNSIYTGADFKGSDYSFSQQDIKDINSYFAQAPGKFMSHFHDIHLLATGQEKRLEDLVEKRAQRQNGAALDGIPF